ncbi:30S ribosomal protein S16 [Mesoplasma syrphidae]|uniref:30S ribosomal protein S16 n=1 Tax=Mesoplasma syrphidae TaxID=225999 RepID=UPI000A4E61B6
MVKLRLKRIGKKQAPFYRIVAADSRVNRNGQYIELVGTFDPLKNEVKIDKELALKWLQNGAQPTDTVRDLFSKEGVMKELHEAKLAAKSGKEPKVKKEEKAKVAKPATKKVVVKADKQAEAEKAVKAAEAKVVKETAEAQQAAVEANKAIEAAKVAEAIAVAKAKEAEEAKALAEKEAKEQAEAEKAAKELAVKYAKEIAASEAKTEAEVEKVKKMSTKERAELDGSESIDEPRSELQKHANKMRAIAIARDIKIKDSNLRDMTKQELVKFMKQVSVKLNK